MELHQPYCSLQSYSKPLNNVWMLEKWLCCCYGSCDVQYQRCQKHVVASNIIMKWIAVTAALHTVPFTAELQIQLLSVRYHDCEDKSHQKIYACRISLARLSGTIVVQLNGIDKLIETPASIIQYNSTALQMHCSLQNIHDVSKTTISTKHNFREGRVYLKTVVLDCISIS